MGLKEDIVELIRKTANVLPEDVLSTLKGDNPILEKIRENCVIAENNSRPICQDTGTPIFYVKRPKESSEVELKQIITKAVDTATKEVYLRPNAVDINGENIGNVPIIHFEEGEKLVIDLLLKGGGSENVSAIYKLPNKELKAMRNLEGVKRCVLETIFKAQGKGCPPYIIGVATGGNIEQVAHLSKKQLLENIEEHSDYEKEILDAVNRLHIGPLGLGGSKTALSVKIAHEPRHPATFFVGISLNCWCLRRGRL